MEHIVNTQEADLVAVSSAKIDDANCIILTFRNKNTFENFNISISSEHTIRLWQDLCMMVPNKKHLKRLHKQDNYYEDYQKVVNS